MGLAFEAQDGEQRNQNYKFDNDSIFCILFLKEKSSFSGICVT